MFMPLPKRRPGDQLPTAEEVGREIMPLHLPKQQQLP